MHERAHAARFTVEGRIGGRWWVWQRFATHDEAAVEIERLAGEKRFDGARLIETLPGWNGAPPVSRELFVLDPNGPPAADIAQANAARAAEPPLPTSKLFVPPVMIALEPPPTREPDDALIGAPAADVVAKALARVAAHAAAFAAAEKKETPRDDAEQTIVAVPAEAVAEIPPAPTTPDVPPAERPPPPRWIAIEPTAAAARPANPIERSAFAWAPPPDESPASPPAEPTPPESDSVTTFLDEAMPLPAVTITTAQRDPFDDAMPEVTDTPAPEATAATVAAEADAPELRAIDDPAVAPERERANADRPWSEFVAQERLSAAPAHERLFAAPANDDQARHREPLPSFAIMDDDDRVPSIPRAGHWRFRLRQVAYTLGAGIASLLLAVASYETTRLMIGLPDLLGEAQQAVGALLAGPERPIVAAARKGSEADVAQLLRGGFSPNSEDPQGVPALVVAARGGHAEVVRTLLDAGADPNRRFGTGDSPLLAATREGLLASVDLMLARGGQVNGRGGSDDCDTPLLVAANAGRLEMVNFLLNRGASFDVLPGCRRGPLDAAAAHPRVRDVLETAYQRRLAGVPRSIPATLTTDLLTATAPIEGKKTDPVVDARGYANLMYGFTWRDTLAEVKTRARECRAVGRRYEVCELQVKPLFDDAALIEAWFDRGDADRFVSIETRSIELVDYTAHRDGATVRQRFDQVRREIERYLPGGQRPIVQRSAPTTLAFFEGLKPEIAAGDYSVFWSDDGRRRPASVHLKLSGIDARKGFYRIVVSNPLRQSQQAAVSE